MTDRGGPSGFVPGLELSRRFYVDVVAGLLGNTRHSAARLGERSEVLGDPVRRRQSRARG
jgi:hypothetical protein